MRRRNGTLLAHYKQHSLFKLDKITLNKNEGDLE